MTEDGRVIGVVDVDAGASNADGRATDAPASDAAGAPPAAPSVDDVLAAVDDAGASARRAPPDGLADAGDLDAIVAPGEAALRAVAVHGPDAPILPIAVDPGVRAVAADDLGSAVAELADGIARTERHPVLRASIDGEAVGRLFRDATLVTATAARISEFGVDAETAGPVDDVRADGVVVATPAGSHGYAAAGDGPLLAPGTGLTVVPIAPFRTKRSRWVLPEAEVAVEVHRDEAAVAVALDGERVRTVGEDARIAFAPVDDVAVAVVDASAPTFR